MKMVSIIIPTRDKLSRLRLVLKTLEPQVDETVEVIVIFDGCSKQLLDAYKEIKLSYMPVLIIHKDNVGRARARNSGILKARGRIVIFLDDDRLPCPDFIYQHLRMHKKRSSVVIGKRCNLNYSEAEINRLYGRGITAADFRVFKKEAEKEKYNILKAFCRLLLGSLFDKVTFRTGNSSALRQDLLEIGMFDEKFSGWGVEDVDLGYRLIKAGIKLRSNRSLVNYHLTHPADPGKQKEDYWRNFHYFKEKIGKDKAALIIAGFVNLFSPYN